MTWDLGTRGLALLVAMSIAGAVVILVLWGGRRPLWLLPAASSTLVLVGVLTSEVWFGWATEDDLQPNIDGLSFDETLLCLLIVVTLTVLTRTVTRRRAARTRVPRPGS